MENNEIKSNHFINSLFPHSCCDPTPISSCGPTFRPQKMPHERTLHSGPWPPKHVMSPRKDPTFRSLAPKDVR